MASISFKIGWSIFAGELLWLSFGFFFTIVDSAQRSTSKSKSSSLRSDFLTLPFYSYPDFVFNYWVSLRWEALCLEILLYPTKVIPIRLSSSEYFLGGGWGSYFLAMGRFRDCRLIMLSWILLIPPLFSSAISRSGGFLIGTMSSGYSSWGRGIPEFGLFEREEDFIEIFECSAPSFGGVRGGVIALLGVVWSDVN